MDTNQDIVSPRKRIFICYGHDEYSDIVVKLKNDLIENGYDVWFDSDKIRGGVDWNEYIQNGLYWVSTPGNGRLIFIMTPHSVRSEGYCYNELSWAYGNGLKVITIMLVKCERPLITYHSQYINMQDCVPLKDSLEKYNDRVKEIINAIEHEKEDAFNGFQALFDYRLKPLNYNNEIQYHLKSYIGREWVKNKIDEWLNEDNSPKIFWICGSPGVGKSAISAWLCTNYPLIAAYHFCRYDDTQKRDPIRCITSIVYQLSIYLPDYKDRILTNMLDVDGLDAKTLFNILILQPLSNNFPRPEHKIIILIDAIDEASNNGKNEIVELLSSINETPDWLKVVITSRLDSEIKRTLQSYMPFYLEIKDKRNEEDLKLYINRELKKISDQVPIEVVDGIISKSEGLFLYAKWVIDEINKGYLSISEIDKFPNGLIGIYNSYFNRQFSNINKYMNDIRPILEIIIASQEPIEITLVSKIFKFDNYQEIEFKKSLESFFLFNDGKIKPFHKSLLDWIKDEDKSGKYFVDILNGHRTLAEYGFEEYKKGIEKLSKYFINYLSIHQYYCCKWKELETVLTDIEYINIRCINGGVYELVKDYNTILEIKILPVNIRSEIVQYANFIQKNSHIISIDQLSTLQQAINEQYNKKVYESANYILKNKYKTLKYLRRLNYISEPSFCLFTLAGHNNSVNNCRFFKNNNFIISFDDDGYFKIWDTLTGKKILNFSGHAGEKIAEYIFSPDETQIISISNMSLKLWNVKTGEEKISIIGNQFHLNNKAFSKDGSSLIVSYNKSIKVLSLNDGHIKEIQFNFEIIDSAYISNRNIILLTSDGLILLLNDNYEQILTINLKFKPNSFILSNDNSRILFLSDDKLCIWDANAWIELSPIISYPDFITSCSFSPNSKYFVTTSDRGTVEVWDSNTGILIKNFIGHTNYINYGIYSNDGSLFATASRDMMVKIWETKNWNKCVQLIGHNAGIMCCDFDSNNKLIISASEDFNLKLWDLQKSIIQYNQSRVINIINELGHVNGVVSCTISPDGTYLLSSWGVTNVYHNSALRVDYFEDDKPVGHLSGMNYNENLGIIYKCIFYPDLKSVIICSNLHGLKKWYYNKDKNQVISANANEIKNITYSCDLSPDGRFIASASRDKTVKIWDAKTILKIISLEGHQGSVNDCSYSPDGEYIVSASDDKTLRIWNLKERNYRELIGHSDSVITCDFSPDGKKILSGSKDNTLKVWDFNANREIITLKGHSRSVTLCAFSPDGKYALSGSIDGILKIWDISSGYEICNYWIGGYIRAFAWHPKGNQLIVGDSIGNIHKVALQNFPIEPLIVTAWETPNIIIVNCITC